MDAFVCLVCGFRAPAASPDCPHCALPLLDLRLPEVQEAVEKANEGRRHKHEQRLLWVSVGAAIFVLVVLNLPLFALGLVIPAIQQFAFALLVAFGIWRGLIRLLPAPAVGTFDPSSG